MRLLLLLFVLSLNTFAAGPLTFGLRGGAPFGTNDIVTSGLSSFSSTRRYEVGPTVGVRLPLGFAIEADALFKRQSLNFGQLAGFTTGTHSDSWEFPVMLKFTAGHQAIAPVFGLGPSVRHVNDFGNIPSYLFSGSTSANNLGLVGSAGLRFKIGPVNVTPEVRYTHWGGTSLPQSLASFLPLNSDEASFVVGLTF